MKLTKRSKTCLVLLLILSFATPAIASPGKYAHLREGQIMQWSGWCFDEEAMALMLAQKELAEQKCELYTMQILEEQKAKFDLQVGQLTASMNYEVETREATIQALKEENLKIEQALIHEQKFGWVTPASLGVLLGGLTFFLVTL